MRKLGLKPVSVEEKQRLCYLFYKGTNDKELMMLRPPDKAVPQRNSRKERLL